MSDTSRFEGRVALITGAARGQGAAHARRFAAEGAAVVLADVLDEQGEAVAAELREAGHDATYAHLDVSDGAAWEAVVRDAVARHGGLSVLVNNAGVNDPAPLTDTRDDVWQRILAINQTGVFLGMRTAIPSIAQTGGGAVVNISSVFGLRGSPGYTAYHASKAAVLMMTQTAAADHAKDGVRVNVICPGLIMTPMVEAEDPAAVEAYAATIPMGRGADPDEISNGVLFLASDEASFVTGATLVMDGGWLARADLTLDLPSTATPDGVGELGIAATLWAPAELDEHDERSVFVCWPGGAYGRDYWDIRLRGREGYSFAEHMTARGFVVIAADPLGVGDSGRPEDGTLCTYDALADAAHGAVQVLRARLADGTLAADLPPIADPTIVGVGHSMGGGLVVVQQARRGSYDAIAVLGYTHGVKARAVPSGDDATRRATAVEQAKGFWGDQFQARYGVVDKAPHQGWLNGPDAPEDIVAADNANAVVWPAEPYVDALQVGFTAAYAARVTVPVMVAFGEFDIAERPRDEVAFYEGSDDVSLFVLARSYHCHNFQDGRAGLWDRLGAWAR